MAVEYRLMNTEDMKQIFDLWVEVYPGTELESWKQEFLSIPGSLENTYVAIDNGRILSTALLWIREMNNAAGVLQRVGNISHVATHPKDRRQGHAKRLLGIVIEQMEKENCDFSILFTSDKGRPLYERLFWQTCPLHVWQGRLANVDPPQSAEYSARLSNELEDAYLWKALSDIYTEFNKDRPFAIQRDISTWRSFIAYKITDWVRSGASVWLVYPNQYPEAICGYLIGHCTDQGFIIAEIGVKEQHRAAIPNLLHQIIGSYKQGQQVGGRLYLPNEPDIITLLYQYLNPLIQIEATELMVRPVDPRKDLNDFIEPGSQQAKMFWLLDQI